MNVNLIVLLIAVPLAAAFFGVLVKKLSKVFLAIAVGLNLAGAIILAMDYTSEVVYTVGGFKPPFGISLVLDEYSLIGVLLLNVMFALIVVVSCKYIKKYEVVLSVALAAETAA